MIEAGAFRLDPGDPVHVVGAGLAVVALILLLLLLAMLRTARALGPLARHLDRLDRQAADLASGQARLAGGLSAVAEAQAAAHARLTETLDRRLAETSGRLGETVGLSSSRTARALGAVTERLAAIDRAQSRIEKLSGDVLGLQDILANKQARGAFGEIQLTDILTRALPPDAFRLQATLSNGRRADALVLLPTPPGPIAIDSKFPLEAYEALMRARQPGERQTAERAFRSAVRAHLRAIAERYLIPGETGEGALMFLPSEAVYAELHANFADLVREGFDLRVWTVSPTTCMATLNTLRAVLKDARMREQAGAIRRELGLLVADLDRLTARVGNLDRHFARAGRDLAEIRVSADKAGARALRLEAIEFDAAAEARGDEQQRVAAAGTRPADAAAAPVPRGA